MLVVWRVLLRAIIKERDAHLAENIRKSCDGTPGMLGYGVRNRLHVKYSEPKYAYTPTPMQTIRYQTFD